MKTLYISDLDGTLLRSNQKTSEYTNQVVNKLAEKGGLFSYATARSYYTAHKVTEGMTAAFPVILYNGAFIRDNATGELLIKNFFEKEKAVKLIELLIQNDVFPIVYGFVDGEEKFSYLTDCINAQTREFILSRENASRKGDVRNRPVCDIGALTQGDIFYLTCIDKPEKLFPFYERYRDEFHCVYQRDMYSGDQWLEIMPKAAAKANAVKQLADLLGCDRIIAFGDGMNDIDMFEIADEAYAVENAVPQLKREATAVIASNDDDGVAKWLSENAVL